MNEVNNDQKAAAIKTLAIIGFITAIVLCVWIAVQVIRFVPSAFGTLASMAESVYGRTPHLEVTLGKEIVNAGEVLVVDWTDIRRNGSYTFTYHCVDGVSAEARDENGNIVDVVCDSPLTLPFNAHSTELIFSSEKNRFTDIPFTISFTEENASEPLTEINKVITIVNATIPLPGEVNGEADISDEVVDDEPVVEEEPTEEVPVVTTPVVSKPVVTTRPVPVVTTSIPVSNPNGFTDLQVSYIGVGTYNKNTKVFSPKTSIDNDGSAALRFEVKNIGTKTSGAWTYRTTLPSDDDSSYQSPTQTVLKPNERAIVTVLFGTVTENVGTETIKIEIKGGNDTVLTNNTISRTIKIVN